MVFSSHTTNPFAVGLLEETFFDGNYIARVDQRLKFSFFKITLSRSFTGYKKLEEEALSVKPSASATAFCSVKPG